MNSTKIAEALKASRDMTTEVRHDALSVATLLDVSKKMFIPPEALYVSCGGGETIKISIPGAQIRNVPMGTKV